MNGYAVQTDDLSVRYGRKQALESVSLDLAPGRIHGLLGRNATGKSTVMSTLASLRAPHRGTVQIDGHDPFEDEQLMAGICLIRESDDVIDDEAASVTLDLVQRSRPTFDREYADRLLTTFRLDRETKPSSLSRGQQSALGAVIGLASRAPLTMFDEVHLGMDAPTRQLFYDELIADFAEHPRTIIIASHLINEIESFLETVTILAGKTILLSDESERLRARGITVTGPTAVVERFCEGHTSVGHRDLGPTREVTLFEELDPATVRAAQDAGLSVGPAPLQDLFIHLTKESA